MGDPIAKSGKIFIGGLSYETTDEKLRAYFSAYGSVTDAVVMKDPISRRSRGFGFITYADPACVDRALAQPTHILDSRRVEAKRAVPRAETPRDSPNSSNRDSGSVMSGLSVSNSVGATKKIFVGGLHYETKDAVFKKYFQQFGKVVSAEVMFNRETNKSRGFGFVIFETESSVEHVLQEQHHIIDGKTVEVKRAVPRRNVGTSTSENGTLASSPNSSDGSLETSHASVASPPSSSSFTSGGTLGGYAAAVRFGAGGLTKSPSNSSSVQDQDLGIPMGSSNDVSRGVSDALKSLSLGESVASKPISAASSEGLLSSMGSSVLHSPLVTAVDPVIDQWNLAPVARSPTSLAQAPGLHPSSQESRILGQDRRSPNQATSLQWQSPTWKSSWASQRQSQPFTNTPPSSTLGLQSSGGARSPFFSMFSDTERGNGTSSRSTWGGGNYPVGDRQDRDAFSTPLSNEYRSPSGPRAGSYALGSFQDRSLAHASEPDFPIESTVGSVLSDIPGIGQEEDKSVSAIGRSHVHSESSGLWHP